MDHKYIETIKKFRKMKILVIGDAVLDRFFKGNTTRLNRDIAAVPLVDISSTEEVPGGAANTASNLAALDSQTSFLSIIGRDVEGVILLNKLKSLGVKTNLVIRTSDRITITKQRVNSDSQMVVRFDNGTSNALSPELETIFIKKLQKVYSQFHAIIISDYDKGVLTPNVIKTIAKLQKKYSRILVVDAHSLEKYNDIGATIIKPNYEEIKRLLNISDSQIEDNRVSAIISWRNKILQLTGAENVAVTLDKDGAIILNNTDMPFIVPSKPADDKNAIGAGDTFIAALTLAYSTGSSIQEAAEIATIAANAILGKEGTNTCSLPQLVAGVSGNRKLTFDRNLLKGLVSGFRSERKKIVFTNGCFDILHAGHVIYLSQAKALGDVLIIGVNTDESVRKLKGPTRPINSLDDRICVLSSLESVDLVIPFHESNPINLINIIKPDVFVKGGDYTIEKLPEAGVVQEYGGSVEILPLVKDRSTTSIIKRIRVSQDVSLQRREYYSAVYNQVSKKEKE